MNPDDKRKLDDVYSWVQARKAQQLVAPFDDVSKSVIGAAIGAGAGSHALTSTISIGAGGGSATVPAAYLGTQFLLIDGSVLEFPYVSKA